MHPTNPNAVTQNTLVKQIILNSLVHVCGVTVPVHYRVWNVEWGGVQSVECEEDGVLSGACSV